MALHKDLTGVNLHEPKGVADATSGSVYVADGAGSGVWSILDIPEGTFTMQQKLYTTPGVTVWTKPSNLMFVRVFLQGGGAGSAATVSSGIGETSSFGAHVTATGGGAALQATGDLNSQYAEYLPWAYINYNENIAAPVTDDIGNWATKTISADTLGATENVTVGDGADVADDGLPGLVYVEEYILI